MTYEEYEKINLPKLKLQNEDSIKDIKSWNSWFKEYRIGLTSDEWIITDAKKRCKACWHRDNK